MNHRETPVWQKAMRLAEVACREAAGMPPHYRFTLGIQITRAATSVACNIAEGWARESNREKAQFLAIAQGSLDELNTQLVLGSRLGCVDPGCAADLTRQFEEVGRMLTALRRHFRNRRSRRA